MDYQDPTGRSSELMFGIITFLIALVLFALVLMIMTNASLSLASVGGAVVLAAIGGWFAQ